MPKYAKFVKEILRNKRKLEDHERVMLNEEYNAILLNKLPPKLKDSWSFSIPCIIGNLRFDNVLCDLGANINLMSLYFQGIRFGTTEADCFLTPLGR